MLGVYSCPQLLWTWLVTKTNGRKPNLSSIAIIHDGPICNESKAQKKGIIANHGHANL